jgi:crossover junction endodeoxyribonuclease RuvC
MPSTHTARLNTKARGLRVLGVDPALAGATGYGIIEFLGSTPRLVRFGSFKLPARATLASRLYEIHSLISRLVAEFRPDAVAVESVFAALNVKTALKLAEVRGVVLLAAAQASIPAHSYSPREVKSSVAGYGAASKQQMQQMVSSALGLTEIPEPSDAADALAVALCHLQTEHARVRYGLPDPKSLLKSRPVPLAASPARAATRLAVSRIESTR